MKKNNIAQWIKGHLPVLLIALIAVIGLSGCTKTYTPRPKGYFRIDYPQKKYIPYSCESCGYSFEIPVYASVIPYKGYDAGPGWININFPKYKGTVYITYVNMNVKDLARHAEDIHTIAYKHSIKADDIIEKPFSFPDRKVYGIIYDIRGNTASSFNFYATDSVKNFLSGSLYFNVVPNKDSLAPSIRFFTADLEHMIETLKWK
jgi:gliding motility-associated lipoprotein GldD